MTAAIEISGLTKRFLQNRVQAAILAYETGLVELGTR
jgi:hypothetical protein